MQTFCSSIFDANGNTLRQRLPTRVRVWFCERLQGADKNCSVVSAGRNNWHCPGGHLQAHLAPLWRPLETEPLSPPRPCLSFRPRDRTWSRMTHDLKRAYNDDTMMRRHRRQHRMQRIPSSPCIVNAATATTSTLLKA